jgi:hypothetical protein
MVAPVRVGSRRFGEYACGHHCLSVFLAGAAHRLSDCGGRVHLAVAEPFAVADGVVGSLVDTEYNVEIVVDDLVGGLFQDFPYLALRSSKSA